MLACKDIAEYFLSLQDEDAGDLISNMKLQKLVYYAQGYHLALYDEPLFEDRIEAWLYGPVVPNLYREYKKYGSAPIPNPEDMDFSKFNDEEREFLDEVYDVYGQFSAWKLRNMTHEDVPWRAASENQGAISNRSMKAYFKAQMENGEAED